MIGHKTNSLASLSREFVLLVKSLLVAPTTITMMSVEPMTSIEPMASIEASGPTGPAYWLNARTLNNGTCVLQRIGCDCNLSYFACRMQIGALCKNASGH